MSLALLRDLDEERQTYFRPIVASRQSALTLPTMGRPKSNAATTKTNDGAAPRLWEDALTKSLDQLALLQPGWAGPDTVGPSTETMLTAVFVMAANAQPNTKPPNIVPMLDCRLQLVWYDAGIELEIIIDRLCQASASIYDLTTDKEDDDLSVADPRVADAIRRLSSP